MTTSQLAERMLTGIARFQRDDLQLVPAPKNPPADLTPAIAQRAREHATLALLVALRETTGDLLAYDAAAPIAERVLRAYFDNLQGRA